MKNIMTEEEKKKQMDSMWEEYEQKQKILKTNQSVNINQPFNELFDSEAYDYDDIYEEAAELERIKNRQKKIKFKHSKSSDKYTE